MQLTIVRHPAHNRYGRVSQNQNPASCSIPCPVITEDFRRKLVAMLSVAFVPRHDPGRLCFKRRIRGWLSTWLRIARLPPPLARFVRPIVYSYLMTTF